MHTPFGFLPTGEEAHLYTITGGKLTATVTDCGASLVSLLVPDAQGQVADVALGFERAEDYVAADCFMGATVGRIANRIGGAAFLLNGKPINMEPNDKGENNLHSGPSFYKDRLWKVTAQTESAITFALHSPDGDQGLPGNADIQVRYALEAPGTLHITYSGICDQDTVFNLTNHSYFNLAGHDHPERAMQQTLTLPARYYTASNEKNIPTGELVPVAGTPMDFRAPRVIADVIGADYPALHNQGGFDHNFEVFANPCAILSDPVSGRTMAIVTDCPGIQFYAGNFLDCDGKNGVHYGKNSGVALETHFFPDAVHHPEWKSPIVPAGTPYRSETCYIFE